MSASAPIGMPYGSAVADALAAARSRYQVENPNSLEEHRASSAFLPGGSTRSSLWFDPFPITIVEADGCRLRSVDGREYIDFLGEYTVAIAGHNHPAVKRAVAAQLELGWSYGGHSRLEARVGRALCSRFAALERVRFTNSGTEANLIAISAARAHTGRPIVLAFQGGYHGSVLAFGSTAPVLNVPFEFVIAPYNDLERTLEAVRGKEDRLGAIILEVMQGSGGCIPAERSFVAGLAALAERVGAVLIFDEVMTSRLGPGGLGATYAIRPDLMTMGKYIGGGFSFGAFGGKAQFMDRFDLSKPNAWVHAGTFNNNVFTLSAAESMLTEVYTSSVAADLTSRGEALREELNRLAMRSGLGVQVTGYGSLMAVHFVPGRIRSALDTMRSDPKLRDLFYLDMLSLGIWIARRGMINLSLSTGARECALLVSAFSEFLDRREELLRLD